MGKSNGILGRPVLTLINNHRLRNLTGFCTPSPGLRLLTRLISDLIQRLGEKLMYVLCGDRKREIFVGAFKRRMRFFIWTNTQHIAILENRSQCRIAI